MIVHALTAIKARAKREGWLKWIRSEADERAALNGCRFSVKHAEHVVTFFSKFLRHSKGTWAGRPFELLDWQRDDIIYPLFGWLRADGARRYRRAYIEIPKKNGKSTLASGIGLYMLVADGEMGAEIYSAATDRDQASIVHGEAIRMVEASPALNAVLTINKATRNILYARTQSFYRAISSGPAGKEGFNGHCCIIDELHVWHGRELWDALRYMGRARRQPLIFVITTAGSDPQSVCYEQHEYARKVLDGTFHDDRFFAYIRACEPAELQGERLHDRAQWCKANPSLGITISEDDFARDVAEAAKTPSSLASFLRYSFNIWSTVETPWLRLEWWQSCRAAFSAEDLRGQICFAGLDLAKVADMTALALVFPDAKLEDTYRLLCEFWMPREIAEQRRDLAPYLTWAEQGHLHLTEGDVCDYEAIEAAIDAIAMIYRVQELAFDAWQAESVTQRIERQSGIRRYEFRQTIQKFAHPTKEFERLVRAGKLLHNGHPILQWQAGHVVVKTDVSGNIRPVKPKHGDYRTVDGIVASIMALDRALHRNLPARGSLIIY